MYMYILHITCTYINDCFLKKMFSQVSEIQQQNSFMVHRATPMIAFP